MHPLLGIHWIATTYGTWLHGDQRGSWFNGRLIQGDPSLEHSVRTSMSHDAVKLSTEERELVEHIIRTASDELGHTLLALTVQSTHVHVVFAPMEERIASAIARLKRRTSMEVLHQRRLRGDTNIPRSLWSKKKFVVFITESKHLQNTIEYVVRHNIANPSWSDVM